MAEQSFETIRVNKQAFIGAGGDSDAQLHIWRDNNDNQEPKILLERANSVILKLAINSDNVATIGTIGNFPLQFQAGGNPGGIFITNQNRVGIGKTNPAFNLDVQGTINATQFNKNGKLWKITDGDVDDNTISGNKIKDGTISKEKLNFSFNIPDGGVGTVQLANNAVTTPKIADNSITTFKIVNGAITRDKLDPSISFNIPDGGVGTVQLANNAVTTPKIADNSITTFKIVNGAITRDKLDPSISLGDSFWEVTAGGITNKIPGFVGIGTNSPLAPLQVAGGAICNGIAVGIKPPGSINPRFPYETISTLKPEYNLRLHSNASILFHPGNSQDPKIILEKGGRLGIGKANPEALLHVFSDASIVGGNIKLFPTSGGGDFSYDGGDDSIFGFTNYGTEDGKTQFFWQAPDNSLRPLLTITNKGVVSGNFNQPSSRELKENITDFSPQEAIETLAGLNPVKFNYRTDQEKEPVVGFIAEDVPELVATAERKGICALEIVAVLTKVIKEQQMELSLLRERVNALEASRVH